MIQNSSAVLLSCLESDNFFEKVVAGSCGPNVVHSCRVRVSYRRSLLVGSVELNSVIASGLKRSKQIEYMSPGLVLACLKNIPRRSRNAQMSSPGRYGCILVLCVSLSLIGGRVVCSLGIEKCVDIFAKVFLCRV